jgi:DeoR/GlpR family transcriptional regulator of sugar metabolism
MLTRQRKDHILMALERDGQIVAKQVSDELGLSEDTIRRDLRELAAEGRLQRVYGGAVPVSPAIVDLTGRETLNIKAKRAIGRTAANLVGPGQIIFLDGGTTTKQLAIHLPKNLTATVVTHSPSIAVALKGHAGIEVIVIGGRLFKHSMVNVGAVALEGIGRVQPDIYFMGATGVHAKQGITTGDFEEAAIKRAVAERAAETILLASSEKISAVSPYLVMPFKRLAGIVLESTAPTRFLEACRRKGVAAMLAGELATA